MSDEAGGAGAGAGLAASTSTAAMATPQVLIVEDEPGLREGLVTAIETLGYRARPAAGIAQARPLVAGADCILLDIRLKDGDGLDLLQEIRRGGHRDVPVIVATAYGDSARTIRAMRDGAFDYLTKPFDLPVLLATVERAVKQREMVRNLGASDATTALLPPEHERQGTLVGTSASMLGIWKLIGRAAASSAPVLITGETGVGKELVARAIHSYSPRAREPFVAVNLAALPATLLESELFGHERGAFTGSTGRRAGRFESAAAGTLFLDEIGDLDGAVQTKLLRVLSDGSFERVGGGEMLVSKARIVSATHKKVRAGEPGSVLREDLYYRLCTIEIEVPPLRARRSDIPLLVAHALHGTPARAVSEEAMALLYSHAWPGNVRELVHVLERAAALAGGEVIDVANLPEAVRKPDDARARTSDAPSSLSPASAAAASAADGPMQTLKEATSELEKRMIIRALDRARGNRSEAARQLGIGRPQLYAKLEEHGLAKDRGGEG